MFLRIFRYLSKKEWRMIGLTMLLIAFQVWLELKMPEYMAAITTLVQTPGSDLHALWYAGGMMLLCAFGNMLCAMVTGYLSAKIAAGFSLRVRDAVFTSIQGFSYEELNRFSVASLITRSTNDITQIQSLLAMGLHMIIRSPLMAGWAIIKISAKQWQWTLSAGICVVFMIALDILLFIAVEPRFKIMQKLTDNVNRVLREHLTGLRVVRAYNAEAYQAKKFEAANRDLTKTSLFVGRIMALMNPGMILVMNGMELAIYWIGAYLIRAALPELRVGLFADMVVFSAYAMQIVFSFDMLVVIFIMAPRAMVSANRILEVTETVPTIQDGSGAEPTEIGTVEFRNVSFRYPGAGDDVLSDISFAVKRGQTAAVIGSTGSGKTSLINLIPRFYDVSGGAVLVDGVDVRQYGLKELRRRIGVVPQKALLFSGTIRSNVEAGQPGQEERVREALDIAQAADFVSGLQDGLEESVAQGGSNYSGGQKQRLSIARALYRKPEILIFDDSFSALDYRTDRQLRSELRRATAGTTCLIVAQRIGTILDADQIIVLDRGRIDGIGTHAKLMKTSTVYRQIAESQLSEEELSHV